MISTAKVKVLGPHISLDIHLLIIGKPNSLKYVKGIPDSILR